MKQHIVDISLRCILVLTWGRLCIKVAFVSVNILQEILKFKGLVEI